MPVSNEQISEVRAFNRDYTRRIGVLSEGLLDSPYSLTEVRVMYEIAHRPGVMAAQLAGELGLDRGYLSRILKGFEAKGLLARATSAADARRRHLRLTPAGRRASAAGSQRVRWAAVWGAFSWGRARAAPRNCACCWWSPRRAASGWGGCWSASVCVSRARRATSASSCGHRRTSRRLAICTSR